jgi:hypothetical protein
MSIVALRGALTVATLVAWTGTANAEWMTLKGVWGVVTQERNCETNAPLGPTTRAIVTYHLGGTISESRYVPVFATGQLSEGHGHLDYAGGRNYKARVVTMVNFDTPSGTPPGLPVFQAGWQIAEQRITMTGPDTFTMTGRSEFVNLAGEVYRTGCASREGARFK